MKAKHACVGDIRQVGMFSCMELVKSKKTKEALAPYNATSPAVAEMNKFMKANGLYIFVAWNILHVNPPLITTKSQIDDIFQVLDKALDIGDSHTTA